MHADQLAVSSSTVRELVGTQFPAWRHLTVKAVEPAGTVNAIFRIGGGFAARFPLKSGLVPPVGAFRLASADAWSNLLWLWPVWLVLMNGRAGTPRNPGPGSARSAGSRPSAVPCHPSR